MDEEKKQDSVSEPTGAADTAAACDEVVDSVKRSLETANATVLVIDDERTIRKFVARSIKESDNRITVFEAANGKMGLALLEEIRTKFKRDPVFIVTDLNMPEMDGWEFIDCLRKEYEQKGLTQGIPIIVLSSTTGEKGPFFMKRSVHAGKSRYNPIVSVAKEACLDPKKYDALGEKGLLGWIRHFVRYA